ncbi:MAG: FAD-dependent oxidoreductase [Acidobacteriota bacterium]
MTFDVAVIGGGIVGAACALECARSGMGVAIIESQIIGGGATAQGMGHIVVMDDSDAQFALTNYSQKLWEAKARDLPADVEYQRCGTIWVAADEEEMAEVYRKQQFYEARNVKVEVLDERALGDAEPNLRKNLAGGLLVKNDSVIYPPCAAKYFIERAKDKNARLFIGKPVVQISNEQVQLNDGTRIAAKFIVNATGSWSPELTPGIEVKKRKGHLLITDRYPDFVRHQLVELGYLKSAHSLTAESVAFNAQPRKTGQILIGSSRQFGVEHSQVESAMLKRMLARAVEYLPQLGELSAIRSWTGFRAATPDKLPLIGQSAISESLWLATGHEGLGITTSTGTAKLLVDQLLNRASEIPVEPYLPTRQVTEATHD